MGNQLFVIAFVLFNLTGCTFLKNTASNIVESPKILWGSSTHALEQARPQAISRTYQCHLEECRGAVLKLTEAEVEEILSPQEESEKKANEEEGQSPGGAFKSVNLDQKFKVFINNKRKNLLVLYNVPGSVNTTEVAVFFSPIKENQVKLDIASLSTSAKLTASRIIFDVMGKNFSEVAP